ncbi:MAG: CopG family transcriptional regulator [Bacillota bacterium]
MKNQNITLSIPKEILKQAKLIAVQKNTSVSKLLSQKLQEIVEKEKDYLKAKERQVYFMQKGFDLQVKEQPSWKRDDLYDM